MKSPLIIGVSALALLTLSATLFAQTATGGSLITQMKAVTHAFTLAGDLNPGTTGLESSPLVGKRTGDMLSAGEYNRLLELVGQGGGGKFEITNATTKTNYYLTWAAGWSSSPSNYVVSGCTSGFTQCATLDTAAHDFCMISAVAGGEPHTALRYLGDKKYQLSVTSSAGGSSSLSVVCYDNIGTGGGGGTAVYDSGWFSAHSNGATYKTGEGGIPAYTLGKKADIIKLYFRANATSPEREVPSFQMSGAESAWSLAWGDIYGPRPVTLDSSYISIQYGTSVGGACYKFGPGFSSPCGFNGSNIYYEDVGQLKIVAYSFGGTGGGGGGGGTTPATTGKICRFVYTAGGGNLGYLNSHMHTVSAGSGWTSETCRSYLTSTKGGATETYYILGCISDTGFSYGTSSAKNPTTADAGIPTPNCGW